MRQLSPRGAVRTQLRIPRKVALMNLMCEPHLLELMTYDLCGHHFGTPLASGDTGLCLLWLNYLDRD